MSDEPRVDVAGAADDIMAGLGDNPAKLRLDKAWRALDALVAPLDPSWRAFIADRYETLANLYVMKGAKPPGG